MNMTTERPAFNGMNGHIVRNSAREGVTVGTVPGEDYGYPNFHLRVTVDFRVEELARAESYETVTHETVTAPLDFAITTAVWNPNRSDMVSGGATTEPLRELTQYADGWDAEKVERLIALGRWHLNSMTAACAHMDPEMLVREDNGYGGTRIACQPNRCPEGFDYFYGQSWLVRPLPENFLEELDDLFAHEIEQRRVYVRPATD